jgi:hypothetical protein
MFSDVNAVSGEERGEGGEDEEGIQKFFGSL